MRYHRDLVVTAGAAALCAAVTVTVPPEGVRLAAALPLCLVLPGYAITAAVFAPAPLARAQTVLLSAGLSITTLALGALILDPLPGGVRRLPWAVLLFAIVLGGCAVAARRRSQVWRGRLPRLLPRLRPTDGALLLGAALCVIATFAVAWTPLPAENAIGYTQLWMLPANGPKGAGVQVGVKSAEQDELAYELEVRGPGGKSLASSRLVLEPGQEKVEFVAVKRPRPGQALRVTGLLYREDHPAVVYRRVSGWVPGA